MCVIPSVVIPGRAKREPGIHNHDREYGFRACAKGRILRCAIAHRGMTKVRLLMGNCPLARRELRFSCPCKLSYGLPFTGPIFYGDRESTGRKLNISINIKGLAAAKSLWRLP
jgi:hypothetical protein